MFQSVAKLFAVPTTSTPTRSIRLHLEHLGERLAPSVTHWTTDGGHTLNIRGDDAPNDLQLVMIEGSDGLWFHTAGTKTYPEFPIDQITKVVIDLKGGNDIINCQYTPGSMYSPKTLDIRTGEGSDAVSIRPYIDLYDVDEEIDFPVTVPSIRTTFNVTIDTGTQDDKVRVELPRIVDRMNVGVYLGTGDDTAIVQMLGDVASGGWAEVWVDGQQDDDTLDFIARRNSYTNADGFAVETGGRLSAFMIGGEHQDDIGLDVRGQLRGQVNVYGWAAEGDDTLAANVELADGSHGNVDIRLHGGNDNDLLKYTLKKGTGVTGTNFFELDGGIGTDRWNIFTTPGVKIIDCEGYYPFVLIPLPL